MSQPYSETFFSDQQSASRRSASRVVPIVVDLVRPASVIDVGCGVGTWLAEFMQAGVQDVQGIDGEYVNRDMLHISKDAFRAHDLTKPLALDRRFALAVSLEVAEHLPPDCAEQFVADLVHLAPAVLFSAAVPGQGGTSHLNERWQDFWAGLFEQHRYVRIDCVRPVIWYDDAVEAYYAQNALLYVSPDKVEQIRSRVQPIEMPRSVVHPKAYIGLTASVHPDNISIRAAWSQLMHSVRHAIRRRGSTRLSGGTAHEYDPLAGFRAWQSDRATQR
jgi:SAM-dependent methyltransferase